MIDVTMSLPKGPVVDVHTTDGRGFTVEEIADRCLSKMIDVADTAHPEIRAQANEYRGNLRALLVIYLNEAVKSDRTTIYNILKNAGHTGTAEIIRNL